MANKSLASALRFPALVLIPCNEVSIWHTAKPHYMSLTPKKHTTPDIRELEIIALVLGGDVNAFEIIVETYKQTVFQLVSRHIPAGDVEQVSHDVFVRAFKSLSSFRGSAPFEHWLKKIAIRTCYDFFRARSKREVLVSSKKLMLADGLESLEHFKQSESLAKVKEILRESLNTLSAENRMVLTLLYLEEYSVKDTAELLGWSIAKVKVRAFRARHLLKKIIEKIEELS